MKLEPYRKCTRCSLCAFFHTDENGRETCHNSGYYFDNKLPEAEECFDFLTSGQWQNISAASSERVKSEKWESILAENCLQWRKSYACKNCALFPLNENRIISNAEKRDWMNFCRCKGYVSESKENQEWKCADFRSVL